MVRARPRLDSRDDAAAVRAEEEASHREGQLLGKLADAQRERDEAEQRARELEGKLRVQPAVPTTATTVQSVVPPGEGMRFKGEFRVSDLRGWKVVLVGVVTAIGIGTVAVIKAFQPERPPIVIDNNAVLTEVREALSALRAKTALLEAHAKAVDDYNTSAFEAACVGVVRATPYTPKASVTSLKRPKCPTVRILEPQPTLP